MSANADVSMALPGPCRQSRHKEGDLTLAFPAEGRTLWEIAFSVVPASLFAVGARHRPGATDLVPCVGPVQGSPGAGEAIRDATARCGAHAPQDLPTAALAGVAAAWKVDVILDVHPERQLAQATHAASSRRFDHGAFWQRYHGNCPPTATAG